MHQHTKNKAKKPAGLKYVEFWPECSRPHTRTQEI